MDKIKLWNYRRKTKTIKIRINGVIRDICWLEVDYDRTIRYVCREGKIFPAGSEKLETIFLDLNDSKELRER